VPDAFDERYAAGILDELPPDGGGPTADVAAAGPFALRGCVLTPEQRLDDGYVVVAGTTVASVGTAAPAAGTPVVETDGVVLPGLIDLHGHPEYNVFAAWEPPKLFANRYRWRASDEYRAVVRDPWGRLTQDPSLLRDLTRYAEARALVGGATAIQGASARYPDKDEALVRNVDLRIFGQHRARSIVDLDRAAPDDRARLVDHIAAGEVTAVYVHLAEGVPGDERSGRELGELADSHLLTPATVIIHGTALTDAQLGDVKDAGAKLVWSPQSNLRLYGRTTHAAKALELGVPLGLGADWLPSGSQCLLGELKVARRQLTLQGVSLPQDRLVRKLVATVTSEAAAIAGLDDHLGRLEDGRPADLLVLERHHDDPWENVVEAEPSWVQLVAIDGNLVYGRPDWLQRLAGPAAEVEDVVAWGKPMALDTTFAARATGGPPPRLAEIRSRLLARYPQSGPIFA
jgi:5-methylthioadenosine/S-adenosylhomocysteine deaminase